VINWLQQRTNIKLLVKLEKKATGIYKMSQQVYGEETMNRTWVTVGVKQFQDS